MAETKKRHLGVIVASVAAGLLIGWGLRGTLDHPHYALTVANYQDWRLTCNQEPHVDAVCQISQDVLDRKSRASIVRLVLWHKKDAPMISVLVPVNVLLPSGLGLRVDRNPSRQIPYKTCDPSGCLANVVGDQTLYDAIVHASQLRVVVVSLTGKPVEINLSPKGLSDGAASMRAIEADSRSWLRRAFL